MEISTESSTGNVNVKPLGARNWEQMIEFQLDFPTVPIFCRNLKTFSASSGQLKVTALKKLKIADFKTGD
jgi:hypothetical protein